MGDPVVCHCQHEFEDHPSGPCEYYGWGDFSGMRPIDHFGNPLEWSDEGSIGPISSWVPHCFEFQAVFSS